MTSFLGRSDCLAFLSPGLLLWALYYWSCLQAPPCGWTNFRHVKVSSKTAQCHIVRLKGTSGRRLVHPWATCTIHYSCVTPDRYLMYPPKPLKVEEPHLPGNLCQYSLSTLLEKLRRCLTWILQQFKLFISWSLHDGLGHFFLLFKGLLNLKTFFITLLLRLAFSLAEQLWLFMLCFLIILVALL